MDGNYFNMLPDDVSQMIWKKVYNNVIDELKDEDTPNKIFYKLLKRSPAYNDKFINFRCVFGVKRYGWYPNPDDKETIIEIVPIGSQRLYNISWLENELEEKNKVINGFFGFEVLENKVPEIQLEFCNGENKIARKKIRFTKDYYAKRLKENNVKVKSNMKKEDMIKALIKL